MSSSLPRKELFDITPGLVYLDGNSLGPLPKAVSSAAKNVIEKQWGKQLIKGWNDSQWMQQPERLGDAVAQLIGADTGSVVLGDTLSIKIFQVLAAALKLRPDRHVVLSDSGNFPTDLYMAQGLIDLVDKHHELRIVDPEHVAECIDSQVAVVMLTEVDYRTGRKHDMQSITRKAQDSGAVVIWDLAHSAGALPVDLRASQCEFAVGCTYKYLNGGPGAPAFVYVRPDLNNIVQPALAGWLGHDAPFAFEQIYRPATSISRLRVGTPPVLQLAVLESALSVWQGVDMHDVRAASIVLCELFIREVESRCPQLILASPRQAQDRGSQVSFRFEQGYAVMQALIARDVIGDFRAPDIMRFGFTPLYIDESDVMKAVDTLQAVLESDVWQDQQYQTRSLVT